MGRLNVEGRNGLSVDIYTKKNNTACLVFRRGRLLYRLTKILGAENVVKELGAALAAPPALEADIIVIYNPRKRNWVVEVIADEAGVARLTVWELAAEGKVVKRFWA